MNIWKFPISRHLYIRVYYAINYMSQGEELSGAVVSRLDYCAGDLGSILAGTESPTGI